MEGKNVLETQIINRLSKRIPKITLNFFSITMIECFFFVERESETSMSI